MFLQRLYLRNFRLFDEVVFDFSKGINHFYGANAQGKTTILEAIYLLMTGRSFRTLQLGDLVQEGKNFFSIDALFSKQGILQRLKMTWDGKTRRIIHNQTELPSISALLGIVQGVVMTPDDIALVKGAPAVRRGFCDLQIAQIDPLYVHHLLRYNRAMKHRNVLLRSKHLEGIEGWEQEMANSASYIIMQRAKILDELQRVSNRIHSLLINNQQVLCLIYNSVHLNPSHGIEALRQTCLQQWRQQRKREMDVGYTLHGLHKDDFTIHIDGKDARFFASEGQQRSCVAALRLAEWEIMKNQVEDVPLMLIDDMGISLDSARRQQLNAYVEQLEQVFITSTENLSFHKECRASKIGL